MSSKRTMIAAMGIAAGLSVGSAQALTLTYEFTGADLFKQVFVDGADGSTAAANSLFDGARLLRVGTNGNHANAGRTYVESQHDNFTSRWNQYTEEGRGLYTFSFWGANTRGAGWGEDFKPFEWVSATAPEGWEVTYLDIEATWPSWYANNVLPFGPHTSLRPDFTATSEAYDLLLNSSNPEDFKFSLTIQFLDGDAFWGQPTNDAPNSVGVGEELVFWFGGYVAEYDDQGNRIYRDGQGNWLPHLYEGNMTLTASAPIPEPVTGLLALIGMGGLGVAGLRRRR